MKETQLSGLELPTEMECSSTWSSWVWCRVFLIRLAGLVYQTSAHRESVTLLGDSREAGGEAAGGPNFKMTHLWFSASPRMIRQNKHGCATTASTECQRKRQTGLTEELHRARVVTRPVSDDDDLRGVASAVDQVRKHQAAGCCGRRGQWRGRGRRDQEVVPLIRAGPKSYGGNRGIGNNPNHSLEWRGKRWEKLVKKS